MNKKIVSMLVLLTINMPILAQNLIEAVKSKDVTAVERILKQEEYNPDFTINQKDENGGTPLWWAAFNNSLALVQLLLKHNADPNMPGENEETPLWWATKKNNLAITKLLLEHNADPNICDKVWKADPLWLALEGKNIPLIKLLLDYRANPFAEYNDTQTTYSYAKELKSDDIVELFDTYQKTNELRKTTAPGSRGKKLENIEFTFK